MTVGEKIKEIAKKHGFNMRLIHTTMLEQFGPEEALSYDQLGRIIRNEVIDLDSYQKISQVLGVTFVELMHGTTANDKCLIHKNERINQFVSGSIIFDVVTPPSCQFSVLEVILKPGEKTVLEATKEFAELSDDSDRSNIINMMCTKLVYVTEGSVHVNLLESTDADSKKEIYRLRKGSSFTFKSSLYHYYENTSKYKCKLLIIQNPKLL